MSDKINDVLQFIVSNFEKINAYNYADKSMSSYGQSSWNDQLDDASNELSERLNDVINNVQFKLDNGDYFLDD